MHEERTKEFRINLVFSSWPYFVRFVFFVFAVVIGPA